MTTYYANQQKQVEAVEGNVPALCPFCNSTARLEEKWTTFQGRKRKYFVYQCSMCAAKSGESDYAEGALINWNQRPNKRWTPLPTWTASFLLPTGQHFNHVLIHNDGKITLLHYEEYDVTAQNDGVKERVDVDLGSRYRLCVLRPHMEAAHGGDDEGA